MIKTNFKEIKEVLEKLTQGNFQLKDYTFINIEEKKTVLAKYLNIEHNNITFDKVRNLFINDVSEEEYNVLTEKESHMQSLINMVYDIEQDELFLNINTVRDIFNLNKEDISKVIDQNLNENDSISMFDLSNYLVNQNRLSKTEFICRLASQLDKEDFLSCDYKEIKIGEYYIYRFNN